MTVAASIESVAEQFRQFIMASCGSAPEAVVADGRWHSFKIADTRHKGSKPGRYLLHADEKPVGWFMDWRDEKTRHRWFGEGTGVAIPRDEIERRRAERNRKLGEQYARAAASASAFWSRCTKINGQSHAYLDAKGVAPHGTRYGSGEVFGLGNVQCVIVPLSGPDGQAMTLQAIRADGERRFWPEGERDGAHFMIGKDDGASPVVFCEGFSTAASIHEATGHPVVMCVAAESMAKVARWAGHRWAGRDMIVAGDDDWHLVGHSQIKRNVGREAAEQMAKAIGGRLVMPDMAGLVTDGGDDFNDMAREYGPAEVAVMFAPAAAPARCETALPLIWFAENRPLLTGNWIIKNLIPAEAFMTIIGHPGCGKSFLALDFALHIAAGLPWQGRKTKQGLVIYLAAEGQRGQQNRVEAWKRARELTDLPFAMIPVAVNLRDREADIPKLVETIRAACERAGLPLLLIVVDTLNRTFGGGDENGSDMSEYVDNIGRIKAEFGCTTVVVHHIPKNAEGTITERGHGSLRGAIETSLVVHHDQDSGARSMRCTKQKDAEDGWSADFKLRVVELGEDEDGDPVTSCVVDLPEEGRVAEKRQRGPNLSPMQRQVYNELLATLEASPVGVPRDIPDDQIDRSRVGKVAARTTWRDRWIAIGGADMSPETASKNFRRSVTDLHNKGLIGVWNDHIWATHK